MERECINFVLGEGREIKGGGAGALKKKSPDFRCSEVDISAWCFFLNIKSENECIRIKSCIVISPFASIDECFAAVSLWLCY